MRKFILPAILFASLAYSFARAENLPFLNDDYARALANAKQRNLPIFVEVWAPW